MTLPRRRRVWIWDRVLEDAGLCRLCGRIKRASGRWTVCDFCDHTATGLFPPNYR